MSNILFISPTGTLDNGAEISIINFMKSLKKDHQVYNVIPSYSKEHINYKIQNEKYGIKLYYVDSIKWWWEDAPGQLFGTEAERSNSYREAIDTICSIIIKNNIDIVITNTVNIFVGAVAAACSEVTHFWLIHEFPENEFFYYKNKIDFIFSNSDAVFAVTGKLEKKIQELAINEKVNSFFPFTEIKSTCLKEGKERRIVSVGRFTEGKNQLELIKAYQQLNDKNIKLSFIGGADEQYKQKCLNYIKENNIKNIEFLGHQGNPWEKLTDKDVCVFCSSMETFGLVYVESILNGIPTIISNNPGYMSAYQLLGAGHVYSLGDISGLVTKIESVFDNFDNEHENALNQREKLKDKYTSEKAYSQILDVIADKPYRPKSIRHLKMILTKNERKSKLAKVEYRLRLFLQKVKSSLWR